MLLASSLVPMIKYPSNRKTIRGWTSSGQLIRPGCPTFRDFRKVGFHGPIVLGTCSSIAVFLRVVTYTTETTTRLHPRDGHGFEPGPTFANPGQRWATYLGKCVPLARSHNNLMTLKLKASAFAKAFA